MTFSTWKRFVRDYLVGLARRNNNKNTFSGSQKEAVQRYFAGIDARKYVKFHTSINSELFVERVSSDVMARIKPGWQIVDMGAGFCDLEHTLVPRLPQDTQIFAIDSQIRMLSFGSKRLTPNLHQDAAFFCLVANIEQCALPDECADLVLCINVTPYLETLEQLAREAQRLLKNGRDFVMVQPTRNPFWEEEFEGVKLNFFNDKYTAEIFNRHNFDIVERNDFEFYFIPFLRLLKSVYASMFVFRKAQELAS